MPKTPLSVSELIVITGVRLKAIANRFVFTPNGTTGAQFRILRMLTNEGPQRPSDIMRYAGGTKSNVSQRINSLERDGLVRRLPRDKFDDRRNILVAVTPKGRKLVMKLLAKFKKSSAEIENRFSAKEIKVCLNFMEKLNNEIRKSEQNLAKFFD